MPEASETARKKGRGRLSAIDRLPDEASEAIAWANAELRARKLDQVDIHKQFNDMLAEHGIEPVTWSSFSRHSIRLADAVRKFEASRQISQALLAQYDGADRTETFVQTVEALKWRVMDLLAAEDDPKLILNATLALQRLSATAAREAEAQRREKQEQQTEAARKAEQEKLAQAEAEAAEKVEKIASEAGLNAERIAAIRKGVLGLAG